MKAAALFLLLSSIALAQAAPPGKIPSGALTIQLRASSARVKMNDEMKVSVFFRSPGTVTIWNALWWGGSTGLELEIFDSSGRQQKHAVAPSEPIPPDLTGKDALISVRGNVFAGFDSQFIARELFTSPGRYTMKCLYTPPLPREYFGGRTIWGREDGQIESKPISIFVDK
jgi:hypothetical protein